MGGNRFCPACGRPVPGEAGPEPSLLIDGGSRSDGPAGSIQTQVRTGSPVRVAVIGGAALALLLGLEPVPGR